MRVLAAPLGTPAAFISAARLDTGPGWRHPDRVLDTYVLIVGLKGRAPVTEDGVRYEVEPGQSLLLFPGVRHEGGPPVDSPLSYYWCHFLLPDRPVRTNGALQLQQAAAGPVVQPPELLIPEFFTCPDPERIYLLFNDLLDAVHGGMTHYTRLGGCYALSRLLLELSEQAVASAGRADSPSEGDTRFGQTLAWLYAHAHEPITVSDAARYAGYSADHLCRKIRRHTGLSASEYLTSLRMKYARELLLTTDLPVKTVAWRVGYDDEKQFMRRFKQTEGLTPTQFRNAFDHTRINL